MLSLSLIFCKSKQSHLKNTYFMSKFLSRKLQPARKAWKGIKNRFRSKLHHPKFVEAITTLRQHSTVALRSAAAFIRRKFLTLTKRAPPRLHRCHRSYSIIYVDELFPGAAPLADTKEVIAESSSAKSVNKSRPEQIEPPDDGTGRAAAVRKGKATAGDSSKSNVDKWKIPSVPQFRGIDERAEEFIAKFRQEMKLEREQSILEFEEMLKRSA